jgi:hypothetical protein
MSQPFRAGLKFGYRPYGPESDLRYIFEFSHRLSRAGLKFGRRPYGPRERMRSLLRFSHGGTHEALALPGLKPD